MSIARSPRRIYRIWTPVPRTRVVGLVGIAFSTVIGWAVVYVATMVFLSRLFRPSINAPVWIQFTAAVVGLAGAVVGAWLIARMKCIHYWKISKHRLARLKQLAVDPRFNSRLPHRAYELNCYRNPTSRNRFAEFVCSLPNEAIVVINGYRLVEALRPPPLKVSFEPIPVLEESNELCEPIKLSFEDAGILVESQEQPETIRAQIHAFFNRPIIRLIQSLVFVVCLVLNALKMNWILTGLLVAILLVVVIFNTGIFAKSEQWIVPGGIASRCQRAWKRAAAVRLYRPENTPLVVDFRRMRAWVTNANRVRRFDVHYAIGWLLPAVWFAEVPAPTEREIIALLDPEQVERESTK